MRRGVSSLIGALIIIIIMTSALSVALSVSSRLREASEQNAARVSEMLSDAATPAHVQLESSEGLHAVITSSRPLNVRSMLLEFGNGSLIQLPGGTFESSRVQLLARYSCEPVRLHILLSSGLVKSTGWHGCSMIRGGGLAKLRDPELGELVVVPAREGGARAIWLNRYLYFSLEVFDDCSIRYGETLKHSQVLLGTLSTPEGTVKLWARCEKPAGYEPTVGWSVVDGARLIYSSRMPLSLYLAFEGPPSMSFSGTARISTYAEIYSPLPVPFQFSYLFPVSFTGVFPVAYSPGGSSSFYACALRKDFWWEREGIYSYVIMGEGEVSLVHSKRIVALVWNLPTVSLPVYWLSAVSLRISLEIREAKVFSPAAELNLTLPAGSVLELYPLRLQGTDPFSAAIAQGLKGLPPVEVLVLGETRYARDLSSPLYLESRTPVTLRLYRSEAPTLNPYEVRHVQSGECHQRVEGRTVSTPLPAPWGPPPLVEAGNVTVLLGAAPELKVTQGERSSYGFARILPEREPRFSQNVLLFPLRIEQGLQLLLSLNSFRPNPEFHGRGWAIAMDHRGNQMFLRVD